MLKLIHEGEINMRSCGEKLKAAREFLGLTQEQVASSLNLTRNIIVKTNPILALTHPKLS